MLTKRSLIFKQTCSWKLQVRLSISDLFVTTIQVYFKVKGWIRGSYLGFYKTRFSSTFWWCILVYFKPTKTILTPIKSLNLQKIIFLTNFFLTHQTFRQIKDDPHNNILEVLFRLTVNPWKKVRAHIKPLRVNLSPSIFKIWYGISK